MKLPGACLLLTLNLAAAFPALAASPTERALGLMHKGQYGEARSQLQRAESDPHARRLLLELANREGKLEEARSHAGFLLSQYRSGRLDSAPRIAEAAFAAWMLDRWNDANELFMEAARSPAAPLSLYVDWGHLFLEKYNAAEAETVFREALAKFTDRPAAGRWKMDDLYVGLARSLVGQSRPGATEALQEAFSINPENLDAMAFHAFLSIRERDADKAAEWLQKGLGLNPAYLPLMELRCALHYFQEDQASFEEWRGRVLAVNPRNGHLFEVLGDLALQQRRLPEATDFYREAIRRNPRQWSALSALGMNLLRLDQEEEGKRVLEEAYRNDPFNVWTVNTLRLLDSFERFETFETERFSVRVHSKEAESLRPYLEDLLERCLTTLEEKYGHRVDGKYRFEMYPDHEDFAVRTLGMPGLGALGATFGRIVAMDSPSARRKGEFHWGSTLWHEVAHVVTLSLSNHKVPRWFTEGISMMEERLAYEGWGEHLTPVFLRAYERKQLLPISRLNAGFERPVSPEQVEVSYYQAGWICELLAERYGEESLRRMLVAYGKGASTEEVFKEVLGRTPEEIDQEFQEELDRVLAPKSASLRRVPYDRGSLDELLALLESHTDNYHLNFEAGERLLAEGRQEEAIARLEAARRLFPSFAGRGSAYELLAKTHLSAGQKGEAIAVLEAWWRIYPKPAGNALQLARLLVEEGRAREAIAYLEESMFADPFEAEAHRLLGELYMQAEQPAKAVREFRVLMSLKADDPAGGHYRLAQALFASGAREEARREILLALEIAPGYREAQQLLLKIVNP
jgi:cellulose synthase operon protein C